MTDREFSPVDWNNDALFFDYEYEQSEDRDGDMEPDDEPKRTVIVRMPIAFKGTALPAHVIEMMRDVQRRDWDYGAEAKGFFKGNISEIYDPEYGDGKICSCGHTYYRHFDSYEQMDACGCKYCRCYRFRLNPDQTKAD